MSQRIIFDILKKYPDKWFKPKEIANEIDPNNKTQTLLNNISKGLTKLRLSGLIEFRFYNPRQREYKYKKK